MIRLPCTDKFLNSLERKIKELKLEKPYPGFPGFNAGLILFDLEKMRRSKEYNYRLSDSGYISLFEKYHVNSGVGDQDFFTCLGAEYPQIYYKLDCTFNRQIGSLRYMDPVFEEYHRCDKERQKIDKLIPYVKKFRDYAASKQNQVFSQFVFQKSDQWHTENVDKFIAELKILVKTCGYNNESEMSRNNIVCGVKSALIREKPLAEGHGLTLERATTICRAFETIQTQLKNTPECYFCGGQYTRNHVNPVKGKTCSKCKKINHFARICKSKAVNFVEHLHSENLPSRELPDNSNSGEECDLYLYAFNRNDSKDEANASLYINERMKIDFKVGTGAQANLIPQHYLQILSPKPTLQTTSHRLTSYCASQIPSLGKYKLQCRYKNGQSKPKLFYVVASRATPSIRLKSSLERNLVKLILNIEANKPTDH
ncbi:hypothetical protein QYM36_013988 [Artemia franciscana]|uniref:Uncharacterized protein n=1 Tax=Artemia franciscana TaxID=6661 RepID=A0AA88L0H6_ARTSF|nr:hypothetical protein QYM36_013988 [Artemia franciscana]